MDRTRRHLLGVGAALLGGTAGCVGGGSNVRYPGDVNPPADVDGEALVEESNTPTASDVSAGSADGTVPNVELARRTRGIVDELRWFGTEYDAAIAAYRTALARAGDVTRSVRDQASVSSDDVQRLRDVTANAVAVAEANLGGHFAVAAVVENVAGNHLDVVEKFAGRDDHDRVDVELRRLADFFNGLRGRPYIEANLSSNPAQNRLFDRLRSGEGTPLFALYHGPTDFATFAYSGERESFAAPAFDGGAVASFEDAFVGVRTPERRRGATLVWTYAPPERSTWAAVVDRQRYPGIPIHVQRYADVAAARQAHDALLSSSVTSEGRDTLGGTEWKRIYYRRGDDVTYAYLAQAGEFLLTTAPSETSWEERTNWSDPLTRSWLW